MGPRLVLPLASQDRQNQHAIHRDGWHKSIGCGSLALSRRQCHDNSHNQHKQVVERREVVDYTQLAIAKSEVWFVACANADADYETIVDWHD